MQSVEELGNLDKIKNPLQPWIVCFTASLFFFYEFIQGNMFASIADNVMYDFHIQADKMNYLSSIFYLSNVIFLFVAGMLLDRFSTKKTLLATMLLCVFGTFVLAYSHSFYLALMSRFMTGIGSAFCFLGPIRLASRWFPPKQMAFITGAIVTMAMTGGMLAQYPLTKLVLLIGWRDSMLVVAWLGIVMFVMMILWIKDKPADKSMSENSNVSLFAVAKQVYLNPQTIFSAVYGSLMNMGVAVFGAMMGSLYIMQRLGVAKDEASIVNSMLFLGAIFGGPIIGWCSDKLSLRVLPMKLGALISLIIMLAILFLPVSLWVMAFLFFLLGFFTAAQVISYPLVVESNSSSVTGIAVSLVSILLQGGYIVYQYIFSRLLLWHGEVQITNGVPVYSFADYQTAAMLLPIGFFLALIAAMKLKETFCQHAEEYV